MSAGETNSGSNNTENKTAKKRTAAPGTAFTFKGKRLLALDTYSVAIPDGFSYEENLKYSAGSYGETSGFAAWNPGFLDADKWETGKITINAFPVSLGQPDTLTGCFEAFRESVESSADVKGKSKELVAFKEDNEEHLFGYIRQKINGKRTAFYCIAGVLGNLHQFRICFNTAVSQEKMERSVLEWLHKIQITGESGLKEATAEPVAEPVSGLESETVPEQIQEPVTDPGQLALDNKKKELAAIDNELALYTAKRDEAAKLLEAAEKAYSGLLSDKLIEEESTKLQIRGVETRKADKEKEIAEIKRRRREIRAEKEELKKEIGELEPRRKAQSNAINEERRALEDKLNLLADEKAEIQEEKADKKSKLQSVFLFKKKKQLEYNEVKSRLKEKNSEISAIDEELDNLEAKVTELKENTKKERSRLNEEIARLDLEEKELRKAVTAEEENLKKFAKEEAVLQEKIKDYKQSITNAANEMMECKKQYDQYHESVRECEAKKELILKEISRLEQGG